MELDHVFVMCAVQSPEAEALLRLGLVEGSANRHPGQGTACRRFFFENAYLELLWVDDETAAKQPDVKRLQMWERWAQRDTGACPFGIGLRPGRGDALHPPFPTWSYRPPIPGRPVARRRRGRDARRAPHLLHRISA
jgi:hypothetical protein